jgi:DNA-binding beta-propeller fold protein YncE
MTSSVIRALGWTGLVLITSCRPPAASRTGSAAAPRGTVIVSNMNDNTAMLIDARSRVLLGTLPTGRAPHEVATSRDGRWALVSNYGVRDEIGNTITVIDVDARAVARTIDLGDYERPHGMAFFPGDTMFAVTSETSRAVLVVDFGSGRVIKRLASGGRGPHMIGLSADGTRMVGGNIRDGTIAVFAPLSSDASRSIKVAAQPEGVAISPDGARAWAGSNRDSIVTVVDVASGRLLATLRGFGLPYRIAITPNGARAVITDPMKATIRIFDANSFTELHAIDVPRDSLVATAEVPGSPSPEGVTTSRDSRWAFVTLQGRNRFVTVDLERGTIAGYGVTGTWSDGIPFSPRSH